ncbi:inositol monophosphatase [Rhodococcus sp. X156]|uniref:inositol monophosphatase family protein n=1 Tax=Rhodococcus sp. X156 TaxID=2499145 RepID=UPI000FD8E518|nr:inositol monophosphatase [Rhodococcus sp. X156]
MDYSTDLQVAFDVADRAADLALQFFTSGVTATAKADGSPVTEADVAVERLLRECLSAVCPGDALLGEEHGQEGESERLWILDPIDGTGFFSRGDPNWRIHVALEIGGVTALAVVTSPALGTRWWAVRDGGAFEAAWPRVGGEVRRLSVSATSRVAEAALDALASPGRDRLPAGFRPPSSPLPLVELVRGEIDGFLAERYFTWDHAPWILLVQEAGGRFTDPTGGHASDKGGGFYSNAALHDDVLTVLSYPVSAVPGRDETDAAFPDRG